MLKPTSASSNSKLPHHWTADEGEHLYKKVVDAFQDMLKIRFRKSRPTGGGSNFLLTERTAPEVCMARSLQKWDFTFEYEDAPVPAAKKQEEEDEGVPQMALIDEDTLRELPGLVPSTATSATSATGAPSHHAASVLATSTALLSPTTASGAPLAATAVPLSATSNSAADAPIAPSPALVVPGLTAPAPDPTLAVSPGTHATVAANSAPRKRPRDAATEEELAEKKRLKSQRDALKKREKRAAEAERRQRAQREATTVVVESEVAKLKKRPAPKPRTRKGELYTLTVSQY
jgi:hypothetical protein